MSRKMVRMSLHISPELNDELEHMSEEAHASKSDILRKAIALMKVALETKKSGKKLAVVNENKELVSEIIGL